MLPSAPPVELDLVKRTLQSKQLGELSKPNHTAFLFCNCVSVQPHRQLLNSWAPKGSHVLVFFSKSLSLSVWVCLQDTWLPMTVVPSLIQQGGGLCGGKGSLQETLRGSQLPCALWSVTYEHFKTCMCVRGAFTQEESGPNLIPLLWSWRVRGEKKRAVPAEIPLAVLQCRGLTWSQKAGKHIKVLALWRHTIHTPSHKHKCTQMANACLHTHKSSFDLWSLHTEHLTATKAGSLDHEGLRLHLMRLVRDFKGTSCQMILFSVENLASDRKTKESKKKF